jgi:hypothetical protein
MQLSICGSQTAQSNTPQAARFPNPVALPHLISSVFGTELLQIFVAALYSRDSYSAAAHSLKCGTPTPNPATTPAFNPIYSVV